MAVLEGVLEEECQRSPRITRALEHKLGELPKGSIRVKHIKGHDYYYLQYRDGAHVRSRYVQTAEFEEVRRKLELRKSYVKALKEQEESRKMIM